MASKMRGEKELPQPYLRKHKRQPPDPPLSFITDATAKLAPDDPFIFETLVIRQVTSMVHYGTISLISPNQVSDSVMTLKIQCKSV